MVGLAEALDIRDTGGTGHSQTVGRYAEITAPELGLVPERVERVRLAGLLHDVGKIGVSDRVITKPGPLDADEWQQMRTHPEIGRGCSRIPSSTTCGPASWPTTSDPTAAATRRPGAADIPLEAQILAVADAYEAMTADRAIGRAWGGGRPRRAGARRGHPVRRHRRARLPRCALPRERC